MLERLYQTVQERNPVEFQAVLREAKEQFSFCWEDLEPQVNNAARDAILLKDRDITKIFLDEGVLPNALASRENHSTSKCRLIQFAAKVGSLPIVELLVERGAQIKDERKFDDDSDNQEAIREAINEGFTDIVSYLLKRGSNPNGLYKGYRTEFFIVRAARLGLTEVVKLLLENGAKVVQAIQLHYMNHQGAKDITEYSRSIKLLLDNAKGVDLADGGQVGDSKDNAYSGLSFLKDLDISGFNFSGIAFNGGPITKELLLLNNIQGAEHAIYS